jgi:hypothetical protein
MMSDLIKKVREVAPWSPYDVGSHNMGKRSSSIIKSASFWLNIFLSFFHSSFNYERRAEEGSLIPKIV